MYILKNALLNIKRNKGRNILIGIIILTIACFSTVTLAIRNTADSLINAYADSYQVEATIGFDRKSMMDKNDFTNQEGMDNMKEQFSNLSSLTVEDLENYSDSKYVKNYYYTSNISLNSNNLEKVSSDFSFGEGKGGPQKRPEENNFDFNLVGYNSLESMTDFIEGNYTIDDMDEGVWDKIFNGEYCIINSELAELNSISVGDTIELITDEDTSVIKKLVVVGIFSEKEDQDLSNMNMFATSANTIITNVDVVNSIDTNARINPTFILTSYGDASLWQEELYDKGMSEYYTVTTNYEEVNSATSSISNVSSFATTFLIITLIIGAIVLFVVNQINIRERKYEIGVLRTIGMRKSLLTLQFVAELSIVALVALLLGTGIGATISKPIGNKLLENEIQSSQEKMDNINVNFGGESGRNKPSFDRVNGIANVQAYQSINATVDFKVVLELLAIGIGLTLLSSISSTISIQQFSPLQILKERG